MLLSTKLPYSSIYDILEVNLRITEGRGFRWLGVKLKSMEERKKKSKLQCTSEVINKIITNNSNSKSTLFFLLVSRASIELEMALRYLITVIINDLESDFEKKKKKNRENKEEQTEEKKEENERTKKTGGGPGLSQSEAMDKVTREDRVKMILTAISFLQSSFEYVLEQIGEEDEEGTLAC